jgi:subtilisin-like proprotein convertase family protein
MSRPVESLARLAATALIAGCLLSATPAAAATGPVVFDGYLGKAGGGAVADGQYNLTFALYETAQGGQAVWSEGPVSLTVSGGRFMHDLGSSTPLDGAVLAGLSAAWVGVQVGNDPELPRRRIGSSAYALMADTTAGVLCSACIGPGNLAAGAVTADKVDFGYAASDSKGGPAKDLACTGCVTVAAMSFDGDFDLGGNSLTATSVDTGSVTASSVSAQSFEGDGSKLSGITLPSGSCGAGQVVTGIDVNGQVTCGDVASSLPKDALDDVSNGVITNEFTDTFVAAGLPLGIKDNFPVGVSLEIDVPDVGLAKTMNVTVKLTNSDIKDVEVVLYDPENTEYLLHDGSEAGPTLEKVYPTVDQPAQGDLTYWYGKNPKGKWLLKVVDKAFKDNTTDGEISEFSVNINTVSNKKVEVKGSLNVTGDLAPAKLQLTDDETACDASYEGYARYNTTTKKLEACNGQSWTPATYQGATYRWAVFSTYSQHDGWYFDNRAELMGGVVPQDWGDDNYRAYQMSADADVWRTLFVRRGPPIGTLKNVNVYADEWYSYSSTNSRRLAVLFRVKNNTDQAITWTPNFYYTSYSSWGERASITVNGSNTWSAGNVGPLDETSVNLSLPANRTSSIIFMMGSSAESGEFRSLALAFYNNALVLPTGLEFVDDLESKQSGWDK